MSHATSDAGASGGAESLESSQHFNWTRPGWLGYCHPAPKLLKSPSTTSSNTNWPMRTVSEFNSLLEPLFPGSIGVRILEIEPERVLAEMAVRPELCSPGGILHGGAYMAFADTLGAVGTVATLSSGKETTTIDSSTKFMASAKVNSVVRGESVALHRGRSTMVWQTSITNAEGKLCAVVTQTQLLLSSRTTAS